MRARQVRFYRIDVLTDTPTGHPGPGRRSGTPTCGVPRRYDTFARSCPDASFGAGRSLPGRRISGPRTGPDDRLDQFEERVVAGLTVRIDRHLCVGFGDCIPPAPDAFAFDDEGVVTFLPTADGTTRDELVEACESCPVDALTLLEPGGDRLVP